MTDERIPTLVQLTAKRIEQLDKIADHLGVRRSAVIRFAIDAYIQSFFIPTVATDSQKDTNKADSPADPIAA